MEQLIVREGESFLTFKKQTDTFKFPSQFAEYISSKGEIYFWPQGGFHVVTKAEIAKSVLMNPIYSADRSLFFISRMPHINPNVIKDFFSVVGKMMVMSDGKKHVQRRKTGGSGINEELLKKYERQIQATVDALLDPLEKNKSIEFVEAIARQLPQSVLADLFQIPNQDREFFNRCSNTMTAFFGGAVEYTNEVGRLVNEAAINIKGYFSELIEEKRKNPGIDFFSKMLEVQKHFGLSDEELISQAVMMLVAGQVTTTDQICNNFYLLMSHAKILKQLQDNVDLIPSAMEEFKRFDPAVTFLFRVATEDSLLSGQPIKKGDTVFIANHCINRDPELFADPERINITRDNNKHFAYGHGSHYCLGARLGRMQIGILFKTLIERFPTIQLDPKAEVIRDHYSLSFSGFKQIPLVIS